MAGSRGHSSKVALLLATRELRHGWKHFFVFVACLTLGVAIMGSVRSFGSMVEEALEGEAKSLLGGDIEARLRGVEATPEQRAFLEEYGDVSYVTTLRSMLHSEADTTLVEIKAIDDAYPLAGELLLNEAITREQALMDHGVIVDAILLSLLGLKIGDKIRLGEATYTIRATLKKEPDRVVQIFSFGPRVMLSQEALQPSGLIKTFSLVEHLYRILTPPGVRVDQAFENRMEDRLNKHFPNASWRVRSGTDGNRTVERFTEQLLSFLTLSAFATFLIAGIGIGSSARAYLEKKLHIIAEFKVLGASRRTVLHTYLIVLGILALAGGLAGIAIALAILHAVVPLVAPLLPALDPQARVSVPPFLLALWYGFLIAYLFSMPALLNALDIRPSLLFRSKTGILNLRSSGTIRFVTSLLVALLLATLVLAAQDVVFLLGAIGVMSLAFVLFGLCAIAVRHIARGLTVRRPWLKLAVGNLHRPGSTTGTVIFAIGVSLTVLIALTLTEANFQARIERLAEDEAPSLFMMDIQPHQQESLHTLLREYAPEKNIMLYPMVRGRISKINDAPVKESEVDADIRWAVRGDRGISASAMLPENAKLIMGQWWPQNYSGPPLLSVDERFIHGMNLDIGSTLTLNILGEEITAEVASARDIDYTTFQINFALMLSPGVIEAFPRTYLATIHLDGPLEEEAELVKKIASTLPGITIIRTTEVIEIVREIIQHIATALRITVSISLFAGLLVLTSALSATIEQRLYDTAILKVLGARQRDILKSCTAEWMLLALITSVIAAGIGTFSSWLVNTHFRNENFAVMPEVTLATIAACIIVIWITGYIGNRSLFRRRPAGLLRNE